MTLTVGCLSLSGISSPPRLGEHCGREDRKNIGLRIAVRFWLLDMKHIHELTTAMATYMRPHRIKPERSASIAVGSVN